MTYSDKEIFDMLSRKEISGEQALQMLSGSAKKKPKKQDNENLLDTGIDEDDVFFKVYHSVLNILHAKEDEVDPEAMFQDIGVDSISSVEIVREVNTKFGLNLDAVTLYDYPTTQDFYQYVLSKLKEQNKVISEAGLKSKPEPKPEPKSEPEEQGAPKKAEKNAVQEKKPETEYRVVAIQNVIKQMVQNILHMEDEIELDYSFQEIGVDSISSVEIVRDINQKYGLELDAITLYDYPTIEGLSKFVLENISRHVKIVEQAYQLENEGKKPEDTLKPLKIVNAPKPMYEDVLGTEKIHIKELPKEEKVTIKQQVPQEQKVTIEQKISEKPKITQVQEVPNNPAPKRIAVIGMSARVPGADNIEEFWENMRCGVNSIQQAPENRWNYEDFYAPTGTDPRKTNCKHAGFLENVDLFEPLFFNISPIEAQYMDPQQRIILEESWKAIEDAGYSNTDISGVRCGVFVGTSKGDYEKILEQAGEERRGEAFTGMSSAILAARISYYLNLKGPSIAIDTACSSSLVAIHEACESILSGNCEMALAGGVRLMISPEIFIQSANLGIISPTNQCRAFDQSADGIVLGEGAGIVVLKELSQAEKDNDRIYAVIEGSLSNQDGKTNGITAPSKNSQVDLETALYEKIHLNPEEISLVECHGTGTKLGDPIEVKALTETFRKWTNKKHYCALGSVKTNIGHLSTAAGVASVIKVILSMKHKEIPPVNHFQVPNEHIDFENSPFYVNKELIPWEKQNGKNLVAAVSSFGFSGTNCHLVISDYEKQD